MPADIRLGFPYECRMYTSRILHIINNSEDGILRRLRTTLLLYRNHTFYSIPSDRFFFYPLRRMLYSQFLWGTMATRVSNMAYEECKCVWALMYGDWNDEMKEDEKAYPKKFTWGSRFIEISFYGVRKISLLSILFFTLFLYYTPFKAYYYTQKPYIV